MTTTMDIEIPSLGVVKQFVNDLSKMEGNFNLIAGRYVIDAKSIMGIFSLDLSKTQQLKITGAQEKDVQELKKYCCKETMG